MLLIRKKLNKFDEINRSKNDASLLSFAAKVPIILFSDCCYRLKYKLRAERLEILNFQFV